MKRKPALVWNDWNRVHITKHALTVVEVEEAYANERGRSDSYLDREMIFGVSAGGKPITISVSYKYQRQPYLVSARPMSKKERRKYLYE